MTIPYPFIDPKLDEYPTSLAWDKLILAGVEFPGIVKIKPFYTYDFRVGKNQGLDGSFITPLGMKPRQIDASLLIYTKQAFNTFVQDVLPQFPLKNQQKTVQPLKWTHPQAELWGIKQVYIAALSINHPDPVNGWQIDFKLLEYFPPKQTKKSKKVKKNTDNSQTAAQKGFTAPPSNPIE